MKTNSIRLILLTGIAAMTLSLPGAFSAQDTPKRIEITAKRFAYDPGEITLKKGEPVVLVVKSGDVSHGLRIRELNLDLSVHAGGTTEVKFTPTKTGDFTGHCSVFCGSGHGKMAIKLHVVD
jgi:cytochrome c oxidase subunit 2